MYYEYMTTACSNCRQTPYFKITSTMWFIRVARRLGSNFVICSSCHTRMMADNKEWTG